jgi:hypothetical protein
MSVDPEDRPKSAQAFADALLASPGGEWAPEGSSWLTRVQVWSAAAVVFLVTAALSWKYR